MTIVTAEGVEKPHLIVILSAAKSSRCGWSDIHLDVRASVAPRKSNWILRDAQNDITFSDVLLGRAAAGRDDRRQRFPGERHSAQETFAQFRGNPIAGRESREVYQLVRVRGQIVERFLRVARPVGEIGGGGGIAALYRHAVFPARRADGAAGLVLADLHEHIILP